MSTDRIEIGHLLIRAPGLSKAEGAQLARLVGRKVHAGLGDVGSVGSHASLAVTVDARGTGGLDAMAASIARRILRSLP